MVRSRSIIAIPPGATIKEQLEDRNMTQKNLLLEWICPRSILADS